MSGANSARPSPILLIATPDAHRSGSVKRPPVGARMHFTVPASCPLPPPARELNPQLILPDIRSTSSLNGLEAARRIRLKSARTYGIGVIYPTQTKENR